MKNQRGKIAKTFMRKMKQVGTLVLPDIKYCKAIEINTVGHWCQDRESDLSETEESPDVDFCIHDLIYERFGMADHRRKQDETIDWHRQESIFNILKI